MKKMLLVVALVAASVVSIADARCGRRNNCATKSETSCAPKCEQQKCCIPSPVIVDCIVNRNVCEGDIPQLCSVGPKRVNAIKHVDITENTYYTCAERGPCEVIPTQAQVDALIGMGAVPADTVPCSR